MKTAVILLAFLASSLATPLNVNWSKIQPRNIYVEPVGEPDVTVANPESRVIGGGRAEPFAIPWQAALIIDSSFFCGGSLISEEFVLTAAHCTIDARTVQVILGSNRVNENQGWQVVRIAERIINHESYNNPALFADIALLRIASVILNQAIQVIHLAPSNAPDYAGERVRLAGWGRTSDASQTIATDLKTVDLNVITNLRCRLRFLVLVRDSTICTSGEGVVGACNGDSGGALVHINSRTQVGIVSFGSQSCEAEAPTAYTRVSSHRDWIHSHSGV